MSHNSNGRVALHSTVRGSVLLLASPPTTSRTIGYGRQQQQQGNTNGVLIQEYTNTQSQLKILEIVFDFRAHVIGGVNGPCAVVNRQTIGTVGF